MNELSLKGRVTILRSKTVVIDKDRCARVLLLKHKHEGNKYFHLSSELIDRHTNTVISQYIDPVCNVWDTIFYITPYAEQPQILMLMDYLNKVVIHYLPTQIELP